MRFVLFLSLAFVGCNAERTNSDSANGDNSADSTNAASNGQPETSDAKIDSGKEKASDSKSEVTVQIKSWEDTQKIIASHKGKVVVLDLWATYCDPCMKEFPHLVELHNKYGSEKLVCLSVSCDYEGIPGEPPESKKEQVLEFLTKSKATFTNILLNVESDEVWRVLELAAIPAVFVYDAQGNLKERFDNEAGDGEFTYEKDIFPLVEELLKKTANQ